MPDIILNSRHLDASESAYATRELTHIRSQLFQVLFPELKARKLLPIDSSVPAGATSFEYKVMESFGKFKVGSGYSNDAPRADIVLREALQKVRPITAAYGYSLEEIQAAMMTGRGLDQSKGMAARRAIEEGLDELLMLGDSNWSIPGLLTLSGTATSAPATGSGGTLWSVKTPDEIVADLFNMETTIRVDSKSAHNANTLVLPDSREAIISTRRMQDGSDTTILQYFLKNSKTIKNVENSHYLEAAPNSEWTGVRAVAYQRDPMILEGVISQEFAQLAPQEVGFETIINCHAKTGGVELRYPKAVCYMDNF